MPLVLSVGGAPIWSVSLELLIMVLEASFTLICGVNSTGSTYDNCKYVYSTGQWLPKVCARLKLLGVLKAIKTFLALNLPFHQSLNQ
jgi:hypothetical protein